MKKRVYKESNSVPAWLAIVLGLVIAGIVALMFLAPYLPDNNTPVEHHEFDTQVVHGMPQGGSEYIWWNN